MRFFIVKFLEIDRLIVNEVFSCKKKNLLATWLKRLKIIKNGSFFGLWQ